MADTAASRAQDIPPESENSNVNPPVVKTRSDREELLLDKNRRYFKSIKDDAAVADADSNPDEYQAYYDILIHARSFKPEDLRKFADPVSYTDLMGSGRSGYQLDLVKVQGRLRRLRRVNSGKPLEDKGVKHMYEGWIFPQDSTFPIAFICTQIPENLEPAMEMKSRQATVAGYYFKRIRYESNKPSKHNPNQKAILRAPLLLAYDLQVEPEDDAESMSLAWKGFFLPSVIVVIVGLSGILLGLTWWFKYNDSAGRQAILRNQQNPFSKEEVSE